jgi:translation initiation factor 2 alpha subunit (eIF-2alpha)
MEGRDRKIAALEAGIEAYLAGDLVGASVQPDGKQNLHFRDGDARERWHKKILAAFKEVWTFVKSATEKLEKAISERAAEIRKPLVDKVQAWMVRFNEAAPAEKEAMRHTPQHEVAAELAGELVATKAPEVEEDPIWIEMAIAGKALTSRGPGSGR